MVAALCMSFQGEYVGISKAGVIKCLVTFPTLILIACLCTLWKFLSEANDYMKQAARRRPRPFFVWDPSVLKRHFSMYNMLVSKLN